MVTGVIQAGSSLGILVPPSVVLVLYAMIARQPVGQLWLAGVIPGLMMAAMFVLYIVIRCWIEPCTGPRPASRRTRYSHGRKAASAACGPAALVDFLCHDGALRERLDLAGRKLCYRGNRSLLGGRPQRPHDTRGVSRTRCAIRWASPVCSCGSFLRPWHLAPCLTAWALSRPSRACFTEQLGLNPWVILILMQLSLYHDGHVPGRHRDAGHRCAALCPAGGCAWGLT